MMQERHFFISEKDIIRLRQIVPQWEIWKDIKISSFKIPMENIKEMNEIIERCIPAFYGKDGD
jgi:hypothetical protein